MGRGAYGWVAVVAAACSGGKDTSPAGDDDDDTVVPSETGTPPDGTFTSDTGPTPHTADTGSPPPTGEVPDPYAAPFLWDTLVFDDAADLGHVPAEVPLGSQVPAGPAMFTEIGATVGLAGATSGGNSHGVGIGWVDVDNDGWHDLFVASGWNGAVHYASSLWRNQGDGTFADHTAASGLGTALADLDTYSVASGDYDADGDLDVYVGAHPTGVLLRNDAGVLVDVTAAAGAGGPPSTPASNGSSKIGAWGDYDGDGRLDVVVASSTFDDAPRHGYLLRNRGDGTFEDVSDATGLQISPTGNPCAVLWTDYDNDGDQDLTVWNDRGDPSTNRAMLRNDGGIWVDATTTVGMTNPMGNPMGIDAADVNRDGVLDYYIGDIGANALLLSQPGGIYVDFALAAGVTGSFGWGLAFEDFDADRWWDIFVAEEDTRPYLTFLHNRTDPPTFTQYGWEHPDVTSGHDIPAAMADFDRDGDVDVATANTDGHRVQLFRNDTDLGTNSFLEIEVARTPGTFDKGGVSGRVVVKVGDDVLWRDLTGGSSRASQNALSARFGLGAWDGAEWVAVLWPDGRQIAAYNVPAGRVSLAAP